VFNRVLILTVDIGGGHTRVAQALQAGLGRLGAGGGVYVVDTLDYINKLCRKLLEIQADRLAATPQPGETVPGPV